MRLSKNISGFSLIELMIVVAIVAIIASIAYPSFQEQLRKGRRTDCHNALLKIAAQQERFHDEFGIYTSSITGPFSAVGGLANSDNQSDEGFYSVTAAQIGGSNQTYLLSCVPQGAQAGDSCGNITLNHVGTRDRTGPMALLQCW